MAQLERIPWKPGQLVGPSTAPGLDTIEDNTEEALRTHRHGFAERYEGLVPVYEAAPIDPRLTPIIDPLNPVNQTLQDHLADEQLHQIGTQDIQQHKFFNASINLWRGIDPTPDFEDGSIVQSAFTDQPYRFVKPLHNRYQFFTQDGTYSVANIWRIHKRGAQQPFSLPVPFGGTTPQFGRVLQAGTYGLNASDLSFNDLGGTPNVIAFDYMLFPFSTWFNMFKDGQAGALGRQFFKTVIWKRRIGPFPDGYRVPSGKIDDVQLYSQLRFKLAHSFRQSEDFESFFWSNESTQMNDDGTPLGVYPATVPGNAQYTLDPGNMQRGFVPSTDPETDANLRRPMLHPDFAQFMRGNIVGSGGGWIGPPTQNLWDNYKRWGVVSDFADSDEELFWGQQYYPGSDNFIPLGDTETWSSRIKYKMHNDNQIDVWPLFQCGFMVILPYGYLPLYVEDSIVSPYTPGYIGNPITQTAAMYWRTPLKFAPEGSTISFETVGDVQIPRATNTTGTMYGYPVPSEIALDLKIIVPE